MKEKTTYTLVNKQNGDLAFKLFQLEENQYFDHIQRNNYFTLIWITKGSGKVKADFSEHPFVANTLFAFYPYQPFMFSLVDAVEGYAIQFHHDFFCIHRHHKEIGCNGVLFNNAYQRPFILVDEAATQTFLTLIAQMVAELQTPADHDEILTSYLKIFLITATRLKQQQQPAMQDVPIENKQLRLLQGLKDAIEGHFKELHTASDYAALLNISTNALARVVKLYLNKTLTELIVERIIIEAKRDLYLTKKPIKEIAANLGYEDEYYFSRLFKSNTEVSPQLYRETVGFGREVPDPA
ncbi:MAG: helix-turn-helix domain-containing protein [Chitinophagaceae bacterium]|nr:helix-turn-helix domain-containing protein [Chitinophagaceae bacterium]